MPNKLVNPEDHVQQLALCRSMWMVCSPACILTSPTRTSTSSELGWATHITNERFLMPKPQLQQAAALVIMLDTHSFRHIGAAASRWPASSRRAAAATRRSARGPHAPRSSTRARIAATSDASDATNGIWRCARCVGNLRALTYGMCRDAALAHGALRARDGVDSLRQCALQRSNNAFSSCASAMGLPPSLTSMAWWRPKN